MLDQLLSNDIFWIFVLGVYVILVTTVLTKKMYFWLIKRVVKKESAIYYNRKFIHIFAGGVVLIVIPFVFSSPWYPLIAGIALSIITYLLHRTKHLLFWFQTTSDINDVTFCFMWGLAIFILWQLLGNPWIAIIPPAFIAFGDGITGIVRNLAFQERRKHPIGNIYMMGVCIPIGYFFGAWSGLLGLAFWGVIAAVVASLFERYEFGPIDDNILITVSATIILYVGNIVGPIF
jgi:hypothetical protein